METIVRKACRALILTPENEVLLIKIANPSSTWIGWIAPGGGIDEGETTEQALRREMREELGLKKFMFEGPVWKRRLVFDWAGKKIDQSEEFFLVLAKKFEPRPELPLHETEINDIQEYRWWNLDSIERSSETFAPRAIATELKRLLREGVPDSPIDVSDQPTS